MAQKPLSSLKLPSVLEPYRKHLGLALPVGVAVMLILVASIVQGRWTERWSPRATEEMKAMARGIDDIPITIGDWDGEDSPPASDAELEAAGAVGYLSRSYRNPKTGDTVSVYMICGASRSVAIHTPDACYPGAGFHMEGQPREYVLEYVPPGAKKDEKDQQATKSAKFTTAVFFKEEPTGRQRLRLFWAWNADDQWEAPDWPRMKYGGRTALNKVYLITPEPANQPVEESSALEFAKVFLPRADALLFSDRAPAPTTPVKPDEKEPKPSTEPAATEQPPVEAEPKKTP